MGTGYPMALPLEPPIPPMLAKLTDELPAGAYLYEPKLDGFRCLVFRDGDDVLAKSLDAPYLPGKRGWLKVKRRRTADCVVAGFRRRVDRPLPSSLLLGLWDEAGVLEHVGVAASFGVPQAQNLLDELRRHV